VDKAA